jgi:hypothetical protein
MKEKGRSCVCLSMLYALLEDIVPRLKDNS